MSAMMNGQVKSCHRPGVSILRPYVRMTDIDASAVTMEGRSSISFWSDGLAEAVQASAGEETSVIKNLFVGLPIKKYCQTCSNAILNREDVDSK